MTRAKVDLRSSQTRWPISVMLRRMMWQGLVMHIVRYLPRPLNGVRLLILRAAGAKIGAHCLIMPGLKLLIPWNLELEDCVAIGYSVELYNHALIRVGSNTVISQYSFLCTSSHDYTHPHMPLISESIHVGSECWIAAGAFIGPGVSIGNGAVIGARSVVTRDMPEWKVCAGNPCLPLKERTISEEVQTVSR